MMAVFALQVLVTIGMIISAIKTQVKTDMSLLGEMILEPFQA
jgi:hypothetical protein